ncbi:uncharacterized protein EV422DRAFT_518665 [Fimicolochytrium jonesii]|uniref:uncharacterized protein n=1 Tax=Fimicolochytrium jonesii TaxID=1396493 RepID=UPI0022FEFBC0|nr:uncharacterized protein EV422DRAFT_518665 [Fimicolochytrium jonesii]KAI8824029.1 hypothetical protein EV422DRAFT_518665 [Fimicolochytrium jonesii]
MPPKGKAKADPVPTLEEDDIDNMDFDLPEEVLRRPPQQSAVAVSASSSTGSLPSGATEATAAMREAVKSWTVVYPIYISSAGRAHRKIPLKECPTATPSAVYIAECVRFLRLPAAIEADKRHPADPLVFGRIRVQLRDDSTKTPLNGKIRTKRELLREIAKIYNGIEEKVNASDPQARAMAAASRSEVSSIVEEMVKEIKGKEATAGQGGGSKKKKGKK